MLFFLDLLRLLFLAAALGFFSIVQAAVSGVIFPYLAYFSSNALFPLISFFLLVKPLEYRNYFPLYAAGKTIAVVLFYVWAVFSLPFETNILNRTNYLEGMILLGGVFFISLTDAFSIFAILLINKKFSRTDNPETGTNGGL